MRIQRLIDRLADSLLAIPAVGIVVGAALALVTTGIDRPAGAGEAISFPEATVESTRVILGTLAGATITVAALVFSIMAVTSQLAASQYSPRVPQGLLRDRFQQVIVAIVVGTFTFSLVALASIGPSVGVEGTTNVATWSALTGTVLGVATALGIVSFVDHINRRVRIDDTIRDLAVATMDAMRSAFAPEPASFDDESYATTTPQTRKAVVRSPVAGWVDAVDPEALAQQLGDGVIARVEAPVGAYINVDDPLLTLWSAATPGPDDGPVPPQDMLACISITPRRTVARDAGYGIRQLVDIALRALSPGINDPTTAADIARHLVGPLRVALSATPRRMTFKGERGVRVYQPAIPSAGDMIDAAYTEIRLQAGRHPGVYAALAGSLLSLRDTVMGREQPGHLQVLDAHLERVEAAATDAGFDLDELLVREGWSSAREGPAGRAEPS